MSEPLMSFKSHIAGKNADVEIYADRIEWSKSGMSPVKLAAGAATIGMSLLGTGFRRGDSGSEVIPVRAMTSVTTKRDGLVNTKVVVVVSGNTIEMRVGHSLANEVKALLTQLMLGTHPAQTVASTPPPSAPAAPVPRAQPDIADQLVRLAALRDQGILTEEEFSAKKAQILGI